ncbi:MAG: helix-turn-helix domain-containing protein [Lachnospiraceae bacterium]|nr:helix-turn-helix domain-containing protein [Lachnospiraceae bacterium]
MAKKKHSAEWMIDRVNEYLSGNGSYDSIAHTYGIGHATIMRWVAAYRHHGAAAFINSSGNKKYSREFKISCVEIVLKGELSVEECTAKYWISNDSVLRRWISEYNANRELKDYNPKREVYMADARRKTTIEERKEIVKYCIEHNRDYKGTASLYDVSYTQVYSWVRKYDADGEDALVDKRGHHKTDDEVDELERLRRENLRLKRQLQERDMTVELLKKVRELEGM